VRLADPVVESLNARINYETLGNAEPALHTHIVPRYRDEPEDKCRRPAWIGYDWPTSRRFDPIADRDFVEAMRARWLEEQRGCR
jgi:diadenosine tetraphosphate (Ap4A) HIT family hydrolase